MNTFQRGLTVSLAAVLLISLLSVFYQERREKFYQQWEKVQSSSFLYEICKDGKCTYEEYFAYRRALGYLDGTVEVSLKEYQKEKSLQGTIYRYLIAWEEIQEALLQEGEYCFSENGMVELDVTVWDKNGSYRNQYCGMIEGEGQ